MGQYSSSNSMRSFTQIAFIGLALLSIASADLVGRRGRNGRRRGGRRRQGRQEAAEAAAEIQGGVDFTGCVDDPETGLCCVEKEETIKTIQKDPILECTHKNVEKCHYTYVTQFTPAQEEVCEENFEKTCQITFKQQALDQKLQRSRRRYLSNRLRVSLYHQICRETTW